MTPFAQTFTINQPVTGVRAVYITSVDLYFKTKSSTFGVDVNIVTTKNGKPTFFSVARRSLRADQINTSTDASVGTNFLFDTPAIVETNTQYAIVVTPQGGSADYSIWTATNGQNDVASKALVAINPTLGSLYSESNDASFTSTPNVFLKYTLRAANFTQKTGTIVYRNSNTDYFLVGGLTGSFTQGEPIFMSNSSLVLASLNYTAAGNTYSVGEVVFQPNTAANAAVATAYGTVYFANTTQTLLSNVSGTFSNSVTTKGATTGYLVTPTSIYQGVSVSSGSNTVSVPDAKNTPDFAANQVIYVTTGSGTNAQILTINSVNTSVSPHTLQLSGNVSFTDTGAKIGRIRGDGALYGNFSVKTNTTCTAIVTLDGVTSTQTVNFANNSGSLLIGSTSGSTATVITLYNLYYDSITGLFTNVDEEAYPSTFSMRGTANTAQGRTFDSNQVPISENETTELIDRQRILMSRSNELANPINSSSSYSGNSSLLIYQNITASNNFFSPYISTLQTSALLAHNVIKPKWHQTGYFLSLASSNGNIKVGDTIWQSNSTTNTVGTVIGSNNSFLIVANVYSTNSYSVPGFVSNSTSTVTDANTGAVANVSAITTYTEDTDTNIENSRYISKATVLADGQDAEDLVAYLTSYRPANTNLLVYGKVIAASDTQPLSGATWSYMPEINTTSLISSTVNRDDLVELTFSFPTSTIVYSNGISITTNNTVTMPSGYSATNFPAGSFVYLSDSSYVVLSANVAAGGTGYTNSTVITAGNTTVSYSNVTMSVITNGSGNVVSVLVTSPGSFINSSAVSALATANTTGTGSGLTVNISASQLQKSTKFNVRRVTAVDAANSILTLSSNLSFTSGNAGIGIIPNLTSATAAFKYDQNNGAVRYVTNTDVVYESFKTFAMKISFASDESERVPRVHDVRCLALQV